MSTIPIEILFPTNYVMCNPNLQEFENGNYTVVGSTGKQVVTITDGCSRSLTQYNPFDGTPMITWEFEYLMASNGEPIHNVYRKFPDMIERELFCSSNWELYPNENQDIIERLTQARMRWRGILGNLASEQVKI